MSDLAHTFVEASNQNPIQFKSPRVVFAFFDGITESIAGMS